MDSIFKIVLFFILDLCVASYREQYRVPVVSTDLLESYVFNNKEYLIQNLLVNWENANIICRGQHNGTLAVLDTREKAEFMAEALSELQFSVDAVWVGARRESSEDPDGYHWSQGVELRRTAADVLANEGDDYNRHYPMWLNRTHVPVPAGGADCVALERVMHDAPVFMDFPCAVRRAFVCEREAQKEVKIQQVSTVRCRTGLYRVFDGRLDWSQAAAYCVVRDMALANIGSIRCLKKLGLIMLKSRPTHYLTQSKLSVMLVCLVFWNIYEVENKMAVLSLTKDFFQTTFENGTLVSNIGIESAWVGARGSGDRWSWVDTGVSIFVPGPFNADDQWPPMRDRTFKKQNGCLQIDRHETKTPVFLEGRCERKMQFICYQGPTNPSTPPSDDNYKYVLVRQLYFWQQALNNCWDLNGTLASVDGPDTLVQLLLVMGESGDEPVEHIWISGHLNRSVDVVNDVTSFTWYNPINHRKIPDPKGGDTNGLYMPPWLDDDFTMDSPCLNLDRQDHLNGLVYGLPCDTPQYSVCMIDKSVITTSFPAITEAYGTT